MFILERLILACSLDRCVQTAEAAAEVLNCPFRVENGLSEWLMKSWYPTDPRPQMCGESVFEVYPTCEGNYTQLYHDLEYPESDYHMRERLQKAMHHLVGDGQGAAGLNFGSILVIAHASGIDALCQALCPHVSIPPVPFCGITSMTKKGDGSWDLKTNIARGFVDHDHLQQGHTLSTVRPAYIPLPGEERGVGKEERQADAINEAMQKSAHEVAVAKRKAGLAGMDADGDGIVERSEWMKEFRDD